VTEHIIWHKTVLDGDLMQLVLAKAFKLGEQLVISAMLIVSCISY
jgi:hypothetical protein